MPRKPFNPSCKTLNPDAERGASTGGMAAPALDLGMEGHVKTSLGFLEFWTWAFSKMV